MCRFQEVRFFGIVAFVVVTGLITGCGGGSGSPLTDTLAPPEGGQTRYDAATAKFHVDVPTGRVSVTPLNNQGSAKSRAVFTGTAINFRTETLVDQPGNAGRKILRVALINRSGEPIGQTPEGIETGVRVIFGEFVNVGSFSDLRQNTSVSTFAGTGAYGSADGPTGSAAFAYPAGVALDSAGNVYVANRGGHQVRRIAGGFVSTLAGSGVAGSANGVGTAASFNGPMGIAFNPMDNSLVVTEYEGNRVRRVTLDGRVTLIAGTGSPGDTNGAGNTAQFRRPTGVAVDHDGTIYVAESEGHRIRKIVRTGDDPTNPAHYTVSTLAGSGSPGFADGVGTSARFYVPRGLAISSDGTLYVADEANRRIRRVSPGGEVVTIAGTGISGVTDGSGEGARFNSPFGIVWVSGALIVSEHGSHVLRQVRLKASGAAEGRASNWMVQTIAGSSGSTGSIDGSGVDARFNVPRLLAADASGNIYIADSYNHRIRRLTPTGGFFPIGLATGSVPQEKVRLWNADGYFPNSSGDPIPYIDYKGVLKEGAMSEAKEWVFIVPEGVNAFEFTVTVEANTLGSPPEAGADVGSPNVWVRTIYWSEKGGWFDNANGTLTQARFSQIWDMEVDRFGNIYLVDGQNGSIRRITPDGRVTTVAGVQPSYTAHQDGPGNQAQLGGLYDLTINPDGTEIFITGINRVRRVAVTPGSDPSDPANWVVTTIAGSGEARHLPAGVSGVAIDKSGNNLFIAMTWSSDQSNNYYHNKVAALCFLGGDRSVRQNWDFRYIAGDPGGSAGDADGVGADARFDQPDSVAVDPFGNLFVGERQKRRIRKITNALDRQWDKPYGSGVVTTFATGVAGPIATDSVGNLYVGSNSRVYRISPSGVVSIVAGTGQYGANDGPGNTATFRDINAIAVDTSGNIYVAESEWRSESPNIFNLRIRVIQRVVKSGKP